MNFRSKIIFLFILIVQNVSGQKPAPAFKHYSIEDGLNCETFYGLKQDTNGYLWFASECGIVKFNGRNFSTYGQPEGLPYTDIYDIAIDNKGSIWATTSKGHIFSIVNDSIRKPVWMDSISGILQHGKKIINNIGFDQKDDLWIGSTLWMFRSEAKNNYTEFVIDTSFSCAYSTILRACGNGSAVLSINKLNSNYTRSKNKGELYPVTVQAYFPDGKTTCFTISRRIKDQSYIPTGESILLSDGKIAFSIGNTLYIASSDNQLSEYEYSSQVICLHQDKYDFLWVGTMQNGLFRYQNATLENNSQRYLTDQATSGILIDHEEGIWVTTLRNGIFYCPSLYVQNYSGDLGESFSITSIFQYDNKVYCSTNKSRTFQIDDSLSFYPVKCLEKDCFISDLIFSNGYYYSSGFPVLKLDKQLNVVKVIQSRIGTFKCIDETVDQSGRIFLLTNLEILYVKNDSAYTLCQSPPGRATAIITTPQNKVLVGTSEGLFELVNSTVSRVVTGTFKITDVRTLNLDSSGRVIVGTNREEIYLLDKGVWYLLEKVVEPQKNPSLTKNNNSKNELWQLTSNGLKRISYWNVSGRFEGEINEVLSYENGIRSQNILSVLSKDSLLFIGTRRGLSVVLLNKPYYCRNSPPTFIHHLEINELRFSCDEIKELEYNRNNVRFYIDVLNFQAQGKPRYKYKLLGFDEHFNSGTDASVYYSNLSPGKYQLIVIGIGNNGIESKPVHLEFNVLSPFWWKWWFIVMEISLAFALIFLFTKFRIIKTRKKEEEKAKISLQLASYQMTALRAQMNPHFIFNAINSIQRFILKSEQQTAYSYLAKFARLVRQVLHNSKEEMITVREELETLNLYVEMEQIRFEHKFEFEIEMDQAILVSDTFIPCMLIQPFVENAIRHGIVPLDDIRKGKITLRFLREEFSLLITIEDNGVGMQVSESRSKAHKSMGISIARNRVYLYDLHSNGNSSNINLIDIKNEQGRGSGVRVEIKLNNIFKKNLE